VHRCQATRSQTLDPVQYEQELWQKGRLGPPLLAVERWPITRQDEAVVGLDACQRFDTGGSLSRRVSAACPSPDGSSAWASAKGGSEVAGDGRERGGNPAAFVFVPRLGRVRLQ
jgi:hypothetical protein